MFWPVIRSWWTSVSVSGSVSGIASCQKGVVGQNCSRHGSQAEDEGPFLISLHPGSQPTNSESDVPLVSFSH